MKVKRIQLHQLHIPLRLTMAHGKASRSFCDSIILELETDTATGWGEILVREYVGGRLSGEDGPLGAVAAALRRMVEPIREGDLGWDEHRAFLHRLSLPPRELPVLCGLEGALAYAWCAAQGVDIYGLLGMAPARTEVVYGGTLPFLEPEATRQVLDLFQSLALSSLRVKVGRDAGRSDQTLSLVRRVCGREHEVAVDANASWTFEDALAHLPVLRRHGVEIIEEPFGRGRGENARLAAHPDAAGIRLMADESALTVEDARAMADGRSFTLINVRLAKNGGILRALALAAEARAVGIAFRLGCHIAETGILSALGRAAAALLPDARWIDGSADSLLLSGNVIIEDLTFGHGGRAAVLTGRGIGCTVDPARVREHTDRSILCV